MCFFLKIRAQPCLRLIGMATHASHYVDAGNGAFEDDHLHCVARNYPQQPSDFSRDVSHRAINQVTFQTADRYHRLVERIITPPQTTAVPPALLRFVTRGRTILGYRLLMLKRIRSTPENKSSCDDAIRGGERSLPNPLRFGSFFTQSGQHTQKRPTNKTKNQDTSTIPAPTSPPGPWATKSSKTASGHRIASAHYIRERKRLSTSFGRTQPKVQLLSHLPVLCTCIPR